MGRSWPQQRLLHPPHAGALHRAAGEIKTKPTQHSVKELREIGIQADALLCRTDRLAGDDRRKIALFCNVQKETVISAWDVDSIYKIPMMLHEQMLDEIVCHNCRSWRGRRPVGVAQAGARPGEPEHEATSPSSANMSTCRIPTSR